MAAVAMLLACAGISSADCTASAGQRAILASDGMNPDVFVWDTHTRLLNYLGGHGASTKNVMQHTVLVSAGTLAEIVSCRPNDARTPYDAEAVDVLSVRVLTGPHRSHYGWVAAGDAHLQRSATTR